MGLLFSLPLMVILLGHEMGHHLLSNWGGQEHQDHSAPPQDWPRSNVMHPVDTGDGTDLDSSQVANVLSGIKAGRVPFIVFEP